MSIAQCPEPGIVKTRANGNLWCDGADWVALESVADFDYTDLDLDNLATAFGSGFAIMMLFFVAAVGAAVVINFIRGKY
jgi:hypothetical protein